MCFHRHITGKRKKKKTAKETNSKYKICTSVIGTILYSTHFILRHIYTPTYLHRHRVEQQMITVGKE